MVNYGQLVVIVLTPFSKIVPNNYPSPVDISGNFLSVRTNYEFILDKVIKNNVSFHKFLLFGTIFRFSRKENFMIKKLEIAALRSYSI